jgi:hypothetical protein
MRARMGGMGMVVSRADPIAVGKALDQLVLASLVRDSVDSIHRERFEPHRIEKVAGQVQKVCSGRSP